MLLSKKLPELRVIQISSPCKSIHRQFVYTIYICYKYCSSLQNFQKLISIQFISFAIGPALWFSHGSDNSEHDPRGEINPDIWEIKMIVRKLKV